MPHSLETQIRDRAEMVQERRKFMNSGFIRIRLLKPRVLVIRT